MILNDFYTTTSVLTRSKKSYQVKYSWLKMNPRYIYKKSLDISKKISLKYFECKLVTELLALCPKRCKKVISLFSRTFLVRVFRQCTFARYALNGHNYFCLQDNEIRCCEVKPREKLMGAKLFLKLQTYNSSQTAIF